MKLQYQGNVWAICWNGWLLIVLIRMIHNCLLGRTAEFPGVDEVAHPDHTIFTWITVFSETPAGSFVSFYWTAEDFNRYSELRYKFTALSWHTLTRAKRCWAQIWDSPFCLFFSVNAVVILIIILMITFFRLNGYLSRLNAWNHRPLLYPHLNANVWY